jgi:Immunoglobulin-like domain of bacterial spore germination
MTTNARRSLVAVLVAVALAAIMALVVLDDDGDDVATTPSTGATTTAETSITMMEPTTTTSPPSAAISDAEAATVVWPEPTSELRFDDPMAAVASFAEELVGFQDPVYGEYLAGDSRSGEVEVRAVATGPATTVLVRQLSDDMWWILGAVTSDIELDDPIAGQAIDDPLVLAGRGRAFEGTIQVSIYQRGVTRPLGEGFVTAGGGPDLDAFADEVTWQNPGGGWGSVVLYTTSAENGQVWQAVALPVGFIGGD